MDWVWGSSSFLEKLIKFPDNNFISGIFFFLFEMKFVWLGLISRSCVIKQLFKGENFPFNLFRGTRNLVLKAEVNFEFEYVFAEITRRKETKLARRKSSKGFCNCIQTVVEVCNLNWKSFYRVSRGPPTSKLCLSIELCMQIGIKCFRFAQFSSACTFRAKVLVISHTRSMNKRFNIMKKETSVWKRTNKRKLWQSGEKIVFWTKNKSHSKPLS